MPAAQTIFVLAILAGAFSALGCIACCPGIILIIVGGTKLFSGNNLIVMAWASRRI